MLTGTNDEGESVGEEDLRQVQDRAPPGRRARDLPEPEAQTEAGIGLQIADWRLPICGLSIVD
jgi:hypothetical protein